MKKDIEWLKNEVNELPLRFLGFSMLKQREEFTVSKDDVLELINQLDEPEVLSKEWINEKAVEVYADTADAEVHAVFRMRDLQNLLVPTLSEMEKVRLAQKTADELNRYKKLGYSLKDFLVIASSKQAQEKLARAWLDGYTVEEEQKYRVIFPSVDKNGKGFNYLAKDCYHKELWVEDARTDRLAWEERSSFTEDEIRDLDKGDVLFEHFAVKAEELEE